MAAMSATETPAPAARPDSVSPQPHHVGALRGRRAAARRRRGRRARGGGRRGRGAGARPDRCSAALPLRDGRHADRLSEHHLMVLGHAVVGGDGPRRQVVGGGDRPQRLAGLHRVHDLRRRRGGEAEDGTGNQDAESASAHCRTSEVGWLDTNSRDSCAGHDRAHGYDPSQAGLRRARPGRASRRRPGWTGGPARRYRPPADGPGGPEAVGAEVALVRAQLAAVEPRAHPPRVRAPAVVLPLARARQRARDAARGPARARRARAARAGRLAHRAGARPHPHRRRQLPQPRRPGRGGRARRDRRALHARQRLLRHGRQPPLRRPRPAGAVAGLHDARARRASATTSGAARTSSSRAA